MWDVFIWAFITAVSVNLVAFSFAYTFQTDKLTDLTYATTFILISLLGLLSNETSFPHLIVASLIILWALRLGFYLLRRVHLVGRDERFDEMRPRLVSYLGFWSLQALTCFVVSLPLLILFSEVSIEISNVYITGLFIAVSGLLLEAIADREKYHFKKKHPNQFMKSGCWRYIRHPNYTGEILFWIGISITAISTPYGYLSLLSPLWISLLLIRISGIPLLQEKWKIKYGQDPRFRSYMKNTWNLIPYLY
ncbi:MAG: DUF1295 domain-containing protein [Saprospiraceae bacterium]|nr:DUF1295 domain-containing protein [Saprospiraceae bacterium]